MTAYGGVPRGFWTAHVLARPPAALIRYLAPKKDPQVKKLLGSKRAVDGGAADGDASESEPGVCGSSDDDDKPACPAVDADDSSLDSIVADGASLEAAVAAADVGEAADGGTDSGPAAAWVPHWKSNLTISMVNEFGVHLDSRLPPAMAKHAKISHTMNVYEPIIHIDEFWLLKVRSWCALKRQCCCVTRAPRREPAARML